MGAPEPGAGGDGRARRGAVSGARCKTRHVTLWAWINEVVSGGNKGVLGSRMERFGVSCWSSALFSSGGR